MELYILTGFVVLLAVIMAIIVIKLIAMVREGRPLLAIGSLAVPLPGTNRPSATATAPPPRKAPARPMADPPQDKRRRFGLFRRRAPISVPVADMPTEEAPERTRSRRILSVSEYEQALAEPSPALPSALAGAPAPAAGPDRAEAVEAAIGAALDRYAYGTASLDDFIAVLQQLGTEVQAEALACGTAVWPDDLRRAQETITWSLDWAHQQQAA